jgi:tRNA threonylcarbamoyl adenosine modification protein YeaZ
MIIVAQSSYTAIEIGLHDGTNLTRSVTIDKKDACAQLIPQLNTLLQQEGIALSDITQIIVNKGPAPFSSLRTVITTMNGISFATGIPLVGVSVFEALNQTYNPAGTHELLIVLRAYSKEYYYGFYAPGVEAIISSCSSATLPPVPITPQTIIIGHPEAFSDELHRTLNITPVSYSTLEAVAQSGLAQKKDAVHNIHHISPLYIKNHF